MHVLSRAAERLDASILLEPEWGCAGQIKYKSGIRRYFRMSTLDLNTMGASEIARDKAYTRFFLQEMDFPIPRGRSFLSPKWAKALGISDRGLREAWLFAKSLGKPVYVKPNSLSRGVGVCKARTRSEFMRAGRQAARQDKVFLVEEAVDGRDYRLVILDGRVISAYERLPFSVIGDGYSSIDELIYSKEQHFAADGRPTYIDKDDFRLIWSIAEQGFTRNDVLPNGLTIQLLPISNLSAGGTSIDVTSDVHPEFAALACNVARSLGLRFAGVDLITNTPISKPPMQGQHWLIEVNSAPGLDHYARMGNEQQLVVEDLYYEVIRSMERPNEY